MHYLEHRIELGLISIGDETPHRVPLPLPGGTAASIVLGVEAGDITVPWLWFRLVHTMGSTGGWTRLDPSDGTQYWNACARGSVAVAPYLGPFANSLAVELSPRNYRNPLAEGHQKRVANWDTGAIIVGIAAPT